MSDEGTRVDDGELVVLRNGTELLAHGNYSLLNVAAVYEPVDSLAMSSIPRRWRATLDTLAFKEWLGMEICSGRVKVFDRVYPTEQTAKEEVITIGGKKYKLTEV